ncbi:MAG: NAD(+)/NADH kinase [Gemmatimonadota bacterium]
MKAEFNGVLSPLDGPINRIGLVGRQMTDEMGSVLERVRVFAEDHGVALFPEDSLRVGELSRFEALSEGGEGVDLLLTLGGDGTLLRGVRRVAGAGIPVLGVNLGRLGFLTSISPVDLEDSLTKLLAGKALLDRRFTVQGQIIHADGSLGSRLWALNDLVLHKGGVARVVRLDLRVDRAGDHYEEVGSFSGDGVIVASPTGSTAYSLSAGGPIIVPEMDCLVVTPISPHTMAMRPLVLPSHVRLTIRTLEPGEDIVVTADGQIGFNLEPDDHVVIERGEDRVALVRFPGQTYFDTLKRVLNWAV